MCIYQYLCADLSLALGSATAQMLSVGGSSAGGAGETNSCQCTAEQSGGDSEKCYSEHQINKICRRMF